MDFQKIRYSGEEILKKKNNLKQIIKEGGWSEHIKPRTMNIVTIRNISNNKDYC